VPTRLLLKLESFVRLSTDETSALQRLVRDAAVSFDPGDDLYLEGEPPGPLNLVLSGYAYRYKMLPDGRRQIVGLLLPGDMCDGRMFVLRRMDHSVGALTPLRAARLGREAFIETIETSARLTRAFWWNSLVEESIAREWLLNVGQRSAYERMAHMFCELFVRSQTVGLVEAGGCEFPFTQAQLADVLGITPVHTNRTLKALADDGLARVTKRRLHIPDPGRLMNVAGFDADYLHLQHEGSGLDANAD
jgi:CRP-like cAMP-binding protein